MEIGVIVFFVFLYLAYKYGEDVPAVESPQKEESFTHIFNFSQTVLKNDLQLEGDSTIIKNSTEDEMHIFIQEGAHSIRDHQFRIDYTVSLHKKADGVVQLYYQDISLNNIPVSGRVTNRKTAAQALVDLTDITKGAVLKNSEVGEYFLLFCSALLVHNQHNKNRKLSDYKFQTTSILDERIRDLAAVRNEYIDDISEQFEQLYASGSSSGSFQQEGSFDIYLRVLEFKSVYNVSLDDIKTQYRKLAKKYHPDIYDGDPDRFKLVTEAYQFLLDNYPA